MAKKNTVEISPEVREVLEVATIEGNNLKINWQLDRPLYEAVNKVLLAAGGKWNRSARAHVFPSDPRAILGLALSQGAIVDKKKELQQFYTPPDLANRLVALANVKPDTIVLEPSAGDGRIAAALHRAGVKRVTLIDIDSDNFDKLRAWAEETGVEAVILKADFLRFAAGTSVRYAGIVMNPPFTNNQDIDHVTAAFKLLKPGGRLVAVMSPGFKTSTVKKKAEFRKLVETYGWVELELEDAFKSSGTGVRTVVVVLNAPR